MTGDQPTLERVYRVLLVDDEELLCRAVTRLMSAERRFAFRSATSARRGSQVFADEGPFDVLLVDLQLADGKGLTLAETLQGMQPGLKVVFMSGDIPQDFAGNGLALDKPFDRDQLVQILETALGF
jgi:DNA-binding NtrC family response regulator